MKPPQSLRERSRFRPQRQRVEELINGEICDAERLLRHYGEQGPVKIGVTNCTEREPKRLAHVLGNALIEFDRVNEFYPISTVHRIDCPVSFIALYKMRVQWVRVEPVFCCNLLK